MSSRTSDIKVPGPPETQEVADGIWAYIQPDGTWWINNTGFLTGPQGVISIDACSTERRTRAYQAAIAAVTRAPVRAVVSTHHHGDHTFGNCLFPGAALIGHERDPGRGNRLRPAARHRDLGRPGLGRPDPGPAVHHVHRPADAARRQHPGPARLRRRPRPHHQ